VGPGGIGKTTVAVLLGHLLSANFNDAVYFFDLGPLSDPQLVPNAVASILGLRVQSKDPLPAILGLLRNKRMLVIFDSCEHVIGAAAALAERIFQEAPQVHIVATSRETLRVEGEHIYRLASLENPPDRADLTAAQLVTFAAAQLFIERVAASGNRLGVSDNEAPIVGEICRRLDGIALAIELAAGRVKAYGIRRTAELINSRLEILHGGRRTAIPRHQTLSATLDWSYNLLEKIERVALCRFSIFVGHFDLDAARSVGVWGDLKEEHLVVALGNLVEKSLLSMVANDISAHYRLLDTTRAYVLEKLTESGEFGKTARLHATFFLELFRRPDVHSLITSENRDLTGIAPQLGNIGAALAWCFSDAGDPKIGIALAAASGPFFVKMSLLSECRRWTERAIAELDDDTRGTTSEVELLASLGLSLMFTEGNGERARVAFLRALKLAEELEDLPNQLRMLGQLHHFHNRSGDFRQAASFARRSEIVAKEIGDPVGIAAAHSLLGISHQELVAARYHLEAALNRVPHSTRITAFLYGLDYRNRAGTFLARALWLLGYPEQAAAVARKTVEEAATFDHPLNLCIALLFAICVYTWNGDWVSAEESSNRLIAHARERSVNPYEEVGKGLKGFLSVKRGDPEKGVLMLRGAIDALHACRYELMTSILNTALVEGLLETGQSDQALLAVDEATALVEKNGDLFNKPELLRLKGSILLSKPRSDVVSAEQFYRESLELAGRLSARAWEVKAAMSLALLWMEQGRREEARGALAPVVDQFTEGFETLDLSRARRLLDRLE
jgi:predicted ATPase